MAAARMTSVVTWVTNVLEAATAISGPACRKRTASASRVIADADRVGDRDDRAAPLAREPRRGDRVGGLARLGDRDDQRRARRAAAGRSGTRSRRWPGPGARSSPGSPRPRRARRSRPAAGDELDPVDGPQGLLETGSSSSSWIGRRASTRPAMRLAQRFGLLVDLLEHEVLVAALLGGLGRPVDGRDRRARPARRATSVIVTPHGRSRRRRPPRGR